MKTAEELLKEKGITPETVHHNYNYVYRAVCDIIGEVQKEAYNQAIDDALEEIDDYKLEYDDFNDFSAGVSSILNKDKQSILKLKK